LCNYNKKENFRGRARQQPLYSNPQTIRQLNNRHEL
jgi:hypothetical protein